MKTKILLFIITAFFTTGSLFAQEKSRMMPEEKAKMETETLTKDLGLNAEQKQKVYDINHKYALEMAREEENTTVTKEQKRMAMERIHMQKDNEMKGVLTSSQYMQYEEHMKTMREHLPATAEKEEMKEEVRREVAALTRELDLNAGQKQKVEEICTKYAEEREMYMKEHPNATKEEMITAADLRMKLKENEIKAVLSPNQLKKYDEHLMRMKRY